MSPCIHPGEYLQLMYAEPGIVTAVWTISVLACFAPKAGGKVLALNKEPAVGVDKESWPEHHVGVWPALVIYIEQRKACVSVESNLLTSKRSSRHTLISLGLCK